MEYQGLKLLNKDELIHLITTLERDIRKEYEKFTVPPEEFYHMIRNLFEKDEKELNSLPYIDEINNFVKRNPDMLYLNPATLKLEFDDIKIEEAFYNAIDENWNSQNMDTIISTGIKQIIAINKTNNKSIYDSVLYDISDRIPTISLRTVPNKNEVKLKDIFEIIFRLRRNKNIGGEMFSQVKTHIDKNGTLFMEVKFIYFSEDGIDIETSFEEDENNEEE